jgi:hypothetical protein
VRALLRHRRIRTEAGATFAAPSSEKNIRVRLEFAGRVSRSPCRMLGG